MRKRYFSQLIKNVGLTFLLVISLGNAKAQSGGVPELMYFKFSTAGTTTLNESPAATRVGNASCTITGHTIAAAGQFGNRLQGVATAGHNVNTGWTTSLSGSWTISMWLNIPTPSTTRYFFGDNTAGAFRCFTGGVATTSGIRLTGTVTLDILSITQINTAPFVVTYVYNAATSTLSGYINGVFRNSISATLTLSGTGPFYVGNYTASGNSLEGGMDEFRMYNRALPASEVALVWDKTLPLNGGTNNASLVALTAPTIFCAGTEPVKVKIANMGSNRLDSVRVNWRLDGVAQPTVYWTSPLDTLGGSGPNDTILTLGSATFTSGTARSIIAWTSMPNGVADSVTSNDSVTANLKASLNGIYTIGGASPDYPTIAAAASDLNSFGICGPVVFNIRTGTYAGQVSFGNISGSSATNIITFQSEASNIDSVNIGYTATSTTDNYVIKLAGTKYISFKNLKLSAGATSFSRVFDISGSSQFDTIQNCSLISATATASSVNTAVIYTDGSTNTGLVVLDNVITGGSWGLRLYGTSTAAKLIGAIVQGNQFLNQYTYGIYSYYHQNCKIRNNVLTSNTTTTYYGIHCYYADSATEITGNKISGITLGYGIYTYYNYGSPIQPEIIANNSIQIGGTGVARGIHSYYAQNSRIYNNSVNITSTSTTTGYAGYFYYSSTTYNGNEIKNNVFANTGGGYAVYNYNPTLSGSTNVWNYNNLYTSGSTLAQIGTPASTPANIAIWRTNSLQDLHSISYNPGFTSAADLQPNTADSSCWSLNGRGIQNNIVTTDINNNPRPTTLANGVPDLGAYEFTPTSVAPAATMVSGPTITGIANQIYLFGGDTVARLAFDSTIGVPSFVQIRRRTGTVPPLMGTSPTNYMYFYDSVYAPAGTYSYSMDMYYKDAWLGTVSNEGNMSVIKKTTPTTLPWTLTSYTPTVDSVLNKISCTYQSDFGWMTGTDVTTPLPVKLISLKANIEKNSINLNWVTASEVNSDYFSVERSVDGKNFISIRKVKANGSTSNYSKYSFNDVDGKSLLEKNTVYYRLAMVDKNGKMEYSSSLSVTVQDKKVTKMNVKVFPNPFSNFISIAFESESKGNGIIELTDITGRKIYSNEIEIVKGENSFELNSVSSLQQGIYFIRTNLNGETSENKVIKTN